jgi:hypothetical protein
MFIKKKWIEKYVTKWILVHYSRKLLYAFYTSLLHVLHCQIVAYYPSSDKINIPFWRLALHLLMSQNYA